MELNINLFADKILYIENVLDDPYNILDLINSTENSITNTDVISKWYEWGSSSNEYVFGQKKDFLYSNITTSSEDTAHIFNSIHSSIATAQQIYTEKTGVKLKGHQPMCINKYFTGKMMGPHVDGDEGSDSNPFISAVLYINDDYEGGELEFPNQEIKIKPSAGSIVMFPSTQPFVHNPKEVISGEKIMCPAFWFAS